jgi:hypothetical protein
MIGRFRSTLRLLAVAALALAAGPSRAITGGSVHTGFLGVWVPASAACTSPLKLVIDAGSVAFVNGPQRVDFRSLEQCFGCAGHDVQGVTMLSTDAMGDSPFMIYLDESKKGRKAMSVDLGNDRKLAARFPFGKGGLKRCG